MIMKKKVGTVLDEELFFEAKQVALLQKKPLHQLMEDALKMYLLMLEKDKGKKQKSVVQNTRGIMKISKDALKAVMEEEGIYET
jgi:hypothetical protein